MTTSDPATLAGDALLRPFEAPDPRDAAEVRRVIAEDYYGGWFNGDPVRMARALHPDLAKRGWVIGSDGRRLIDADTAATMDRWTREGQGRTDEPGERALEVRVVEVYGDIATALVHTRRYIETIQLVRTPDGWRILNALWQTIQTSP